MIPYFMIPAIPHSRNCKSLRQKNEFMASSIYSTGNEQKVSKGTKKNV